MQTHDLLASLDLLRGLVELTTAGVGLYGGLVLALGARSRARGGDHNRTAPSQTMQDTNDHASDDHGADDPGLPA
ncbi:hypothetical protein [Streptosporangium sp. NPDC051022]|uniref:hypothetical protein n=1 Tax=Streptosporangium sp. NPDC051022 TaxID=3155752 RepID=UPI003444EE63